MATMQPPIAERPILDNFHSFSADAIDMELDDSSARLPSEAQLVLVCLDYLRDLRRTYNREDLNIAEGLDADYISIAVYALSRSFLGPEQLVMTSEDGNDAMMDRTKARKIDPDSFITDQRDDNIICIPDIATIEKEIIYSENPATIEPKDAEKVDEIDPRNWYDYDDSHLSNSHRFYALNGFASGPTMRGSLTLGEIATAGLSGLGARSRIEAEKEMIQGELFEQFVSAVRSKGFFRDPGNETPMQDPEEEVLRQERVADTYEDRYRKVVAKFRNKLTNKAGLALLTKAGGDAKVLTAAEQQTLRRNKRIDSARAAHAKWQEENPGALYDSDRASYVPVDPLSPASQEGAVDSVSVNSTRLNENPIDVKEAEKLKTVGNKFMQNKEYSEAVESYTMALKLCPAGPTSHVYFSNRAAALLSMKKFDEAIVDSERSLALKPDYGKAHARLGLAHFLLGNYKQATDAYSISLKYEPNNKSSKVYLEKAKKRMQTGSKKKGKSTGAPVSTSFSVVSEWEKAPLKSKVTAVSATFEDQDERTYLVDQREAEKYKHKGNSHMASREYQFAVDAYSAAIDLSSDGPTSHVYFSNRAAALCYLERYVEAELDSERSLALKPNYGKAHARLGLSRFFMADYEGAVEAYMSALQFDPDNAASKSYLAKAVARLERTKQEQSESEDRSGYDAPIRSSPRENKREQSIAEEEVFEASAHAPFPRASAPLKGSAARKSTSEQTSDSNFGEEAIEAEYIAADPELLDMDSHESEDSEGDTQK